MCRACQGGPHPGDVSQADVLGGGGERAGVDRRGEERHLGGTACVSGWQMQQLDVGEVRALVRAIQLGRPQPTVPYQTVLIAVCGLHHHPAISSCACQWVGRLVAALLLGSLPPQMEGCPPPLCFSTTKAQVV